LFAMVVNDNAASLTPRGVLRFFASKLAPTRDMRWSVPYPAGIKKRALGTRWKVGLTSVPGLKHKGSIALCCILWRGGLPPLDYEVVPNPGNSECLKNRENLYYDRCAAERGDAAFRQAPSPQVLASRKASLNEQAFA
jgi:hypothetical protein